MVAKTPYCNRLVCRGSRRLTTMANDAEVSQATEQSQRALLEETWRNPQAARESLAYRALHSSFHLLLQHCTFDKMKANTAHLSSTTTSLCLTKLIKLKSSCESPNYDDKRSIHVTYPDMKNASSYFACE